MVFKATPYNWGKIFLAAQKRKNLLQFPATGYEFL